jgi:putative aldouronate transport system permease protein
VYRKGLLEMDYSYSAAVGLFNSVINFLLLLTVNKISRRVSETSLW